MIKSIAKYYIVAFLFLISFNIAKAQNKIKNLSDFKLDGITIDLIEEIENNKFTEPNQNKVFPYLPTFVRIVLTSRPTTESNIKIEVWLPKENWNGRFLGTGNGGGGGSFYYESLVSGLKRGFAVANTDLGTSPSANAMVEYPERWKDFGYRATHEMTVVAKALIEKYYEKIPLYSYFIGCSTGGQQGLAEAQRYPNDYDGIIAGAPAYNRIHLHSWFLRNYQITNRDPDNLFSSEQIKQISDILIKENVGKDGGADSDLFLTDPRMARINYEVFDTILSPKQVEALRRISEEPINPTIGERIHPSFPIGSEKEWMGLEFQQNLNSIKEHFYPFLWIWGDTYDFLSFDFGKDLNKVDSILGPILNANDPNLNAFKKRGGKLLMYTGTSDPIVPFQDAIRYYEDVVERQGSLNETQSFFQYYLIPGMGHCGGGSGLNDLGQYLPTEINSAEEDILTTMIDWVENGKKPERMIAKGFKEGVEFKRPVYPYPLFPRYKGGDTSMPSNFEPVLHSRK